MFLIFLIFGGPDPKIEGGGSGPLASSYYPPGYNYNISNILTSTKQL